jgi:ATP-binding cassette subfamily F protein 3
MTQIAVANAAVEFGSTTLLDKVTFTVAAGEKWGVIGRNGAGKTTIFRLITGTLQPTRGVVSRQPGLRVVLLEQHRDFGDARTVWEAVAGSLAELFELERSLEAQATRIGELGARADEAMLDRYARDLERFAREDGYSLAARVDAVIHGLGFDPDEARTKELAHLSGGERGRVGLARQLVAPADVLLLDEPTNHLDLETTRWLERYLRETERTVILVSHDREFLAEVVDHVLHVEHGTATPYTGGYEAFVAQRTERRLAQQRSFEKQSRVVAAEEDYIRRNIAGVNTRQAKGRRKRLARLPRLSPPPGDEDTMALRLDVAERGGDQVVVAEKATVAIMDPQAGTPRVLVEGLTAQIRRGDRVGLVGPNGAGKSTLLKTLMGERPPAAGVLRVGSSVTPAYYRQDLTQVPMDRTLYDVIQEVRPLWGRGQIQGHLGRFGFSGDEVQRRADTLSGGERARVALAMMVLSQANLLILDEPTNHLDVESIEALEDAIERYEGTVLLVSHDRAMLRALTNRTWVLHDRRVTTFDGGFGEWEAASAEREHAAAVRAAEEEALRKVHEKQRLQRQAPTPTERDRSRLRTARRAVEAAEQKVEREEARVSELAARLEDPALYTRADGPKVAAELGRDLDRARAALDAALAEWTAASEAAEALVSGPA